MQGPPGDPRFGNPSYPHAQAYGQQPYAQQPQPQVQQPAMPQPPMHAGWGGGLAAQAGRFQMPGALGNVAQPSGLPAPLAFGLGLAAVVVALVFDVIFLKVHIPGVGGYAWYLTTALSFGGAGFGGAKWTKASKTLAGASVVVAAVLYGIADLGLGMVLEDLSMGSAIFLAVQGFAIALFTGFGGVYRGSHAKE